MANGEIILTKAGLKEKQEKLEYLKIVRRGQISEQIKEARAFGDLSENAEYDEAKNEQARVENEIASLENILRNAIIVDDSELDLSKVSIGTTVKILDVELGEEEEYYIVGSIEADPDRGHISNESPVGSALMGRKVGDLVDVESPSGVFQVKIVDIHR